MIVTDLPSAWTIQCMLDIEYVVCFSGMIFRDCNILIFFIYNDILFSNEVLFLNDILFYRLVQAEYYTEGEVSHISNLLHFPEVHNYHP